MAEITKREVDRNINTIKNNPNRDFGDLKINTARDAASFSDSTDDLSEKIHYAETGHKIHQDNMTRYFLALAYNDSDRQEDALRICEETELHCEHTKYHFGMRQLGCKILLEQGDDLYFPQFIITIFESPDFANNWPLMDGGWGYSWSDDTLTAKITQQLKETFDHAPDDYRNLYVLGAYKALKSKDLTIKNEGLSQCMQALDMQPNCKAMAILHPQINVKALKGTPQETSVSECIDTLSTHFAEKAEAADKNTERFTLINEGIEHLKLAQQTLSN